MPQQRTLLVHISCLASGGNAPDGNHQSGFPLWSMQDAAVLFDDRIRWIGPSSHALSMLRDGEIDPDIVVGMSGKTVIPAFVDSHTHIVFAGNRSVEFGRRLSGVSYQQIASEGGGILSTVRSVRQASEDEIFENALLLAESAKSHGTGTIEVKSGYGLDTESELKLLRAANRLETTTGLRVVITFLGAHDIPPEFRSDRDAYIDLLCNEMIPEVSRLGLASYCDVFCDTGYFTIAEARQILHAGLAAGLRPKLHADELSSFGAAGLAAELGARSADHLLFASAEDLERMKNAGTVATLLPGTAYTLRLPYAPARTMIDAGLTVALATDCNPGSCFTENMQTIVSLACINMHMSVEEALVSATLNGAVALDLAHETGSIEIGKSADLAILDTEHYSGLAYHFGINHIGEMWIKGQRQFHSNEGKW